MNKIKLTIILPLLVFFVTGCNGLKTTPSQTKLFINELMASNNSVIADENNEFDDWIEIYNPNDSAVDLGGMFLSDNKLKLTKWEIPKTDSSQTTISPRGYLIIWADNQPQQGVRHTNFRLSSLGGEVALTDANGWRIDYIRYQPLDKNFSFGRTNDGAPTWQLFKKGTPGQSNHE